MMLVSSSRLPFIEVHPLAPLLDGLDHLAGGFRVQDAGKSPEVLARYALGSPRGKAMNEFSGACLLLGRQSIQVAEDLFLDRRVDHRHLLGFAGFSLAPCKVIEVEPRSSCSWPASRDRASVPLRASRRLFYRPSPRSR